MSRSKLAAPVAVRRAAVPDTWIRPLSGPATLGVGTNMAAAGATSRLSMSTVALICASPKARPGAALTVASAMVSLTLPGWACALPLTRRASPAVAWVTVTSIASRVNWALFAPAFW